MWNRHFKQSSVFPKAVGSWNPLFLFSDRYLQAKGSAEHNLSSVAFDIRVLLCLAVAMGKDVFISEGSGVTKGPSCCILKHPRIHAKAMTTRGCSSQ